MRVAIVGGGIAGLAAAHRLKAAGGCEVYVFESAERPGGKIGTERLDGFTVERGADTFLSRKPQARQLCEELGIADRIVETRPDTRGSFISHGGVLHPVPEGMSGLVPGRIEPLLRSSLLSSVAKARASKENTVPRGSGADETIADFVTRRFGRDVYDRVVEPLLCGIYAGDGERLSLQAAAPAVYSLEQEHGSVTKGVGESESTGGSGFVSLRGGMGELVDALAAHLKGSVRLNHRVTSLRRTRSGRRGAAIGWLLDGVDQTDPFDAVILAVPADVAAGIVQDHDRECGSLLRTIRYVSTALVTLGFDGATVSHPLSGYGYVIPRRERRTALACTWTSSKLHNRAPENAVLLRVFFGRDGRPIDRFNDERLEGEARSELRNALGIDAEPVLRRVDRYERAMPQYDLGHLDRIAAIRNRLRKPGDLYVAGSAYDGVGIPDCIVSGWKAAEAVLGARRGGATLARG